MPKQIPNEELPEIEFDIDKDQRGPDIYYFIQAGNRIVCRRPGLEALVDAIMEELNRDGP